MCEHDSKTTLSSQDESSLKMDLCKVENCSVVSGLEMSNYFLKTGCHMLRTKVSAYRIDNLHTRKGTINAERYIMLMFQSDICSHPDVIFSEDLGTGMLQNVKDGTNLLQSKRTLKHT